MELSSTSISILISLTCILVTSFLWSIFKWVWWNPKRFERILKEQGFKGNSYKFFYGDSKEKDRVIMEANSKPLSSFTNDHISRTKPFYHHTVKNYGKKSFMWNGPVPVLNISEPEHMREVFMKMNDFQKPQVNPILKVIATGLFDFEGEVWAQHRKLLNPAFHLEKLKLMLPAFSISANEMIKKWEQMTSETGSCELDTCPFLHALSADAISRAAFGSSFEEGRKLFQLLTDQLVVAMPLISSMYIPGWRFVPTKGNRRLMQLEREIKSLLKDLINKRLEDIKSGKKPNDDLLDILLDSSMKDNENGNGNNKKHIISITLDEVMNECKVFYLAGELTTSTMLAWTLILLGKHQDWQERAREEVLSTIGSHDTPDFQGLNHLKTLNMILHEALRLYSPVPDVERTVCKDIKVGDIVIPAGVQVHLPIIDVHQDEELWGPDAKEFNPQRFSEGVSKASGGNRSFFPFGGGPRICIGSNFALIEARMAIALILQRFSFELSPSYAHAPAAISTIQPQFGAQIVLKRLCRQ